MDRPGRAGHHAALHQAEDHQRSALRRVVDRLARRLSGPDRKQIEGVVQLELPSGGIRTARGPGRVRWRIRAAEPLGRQRVELQTAIAVGRLGHARGARRRIRMAELVHRQQEVLQMAPDVARARRVRAAWG